MVGSDWLSLESRAFPKSVSSLHKLNGTDLTGARWNTAKGDSVDCFAADRAPVSEVDVLPPARGGTGEKAGSDRGRDGIGQSDPGEGFGADSGHRSRAAQGAGRNLSGTGRSAPTLDRRADRAAGWSPATLTRVESS